MTPASMATITAPASAVNASQITRACSGVGPGKFIAGRSHLDGGSRRKTTEPVGPELPRRSDLWPACSFLSVRPELLRFLRRRPHGTHERAAHAGFLQFVNAFDGRATGTGHHVLENARVQAGFQRHFRASEQGLR